MKVFLISRKTNAVIRRFLKLASCTTFAFFLLAPFMMLASPPESCVLQSFVDDHAIAGAVTLVARHNQVLSLDLVGWSDLDKKVAMRTDTLFWIASMTKPMTAVAVLMLQDEGLLNVNDPVEKYLPEFKDQWVVESKASTNLLLRPPARPVLIRDLLTHTAGLGGFEPPRNDSSLAELTMAYAREPLKFDPGSRWAYSDQGFNTLGRIIEIVSGQPYTAFMQRRIFQPLGMKDTVFWLSPAQERRLAKSYEPVSDGVGLKKTDIALLKGKLGDRQRTAFPCRGLFSTAADVLRFYQLMLDHGIWGGHRLLSESAVSEMTRSQTGDLKAGFVDGMGYGYGFAVVKQPQGVTRMLSPGTFGHGGFYGTQSWADPEKDLIIVMLIQLSNLPNGDDSEMRKAFQEWAVATFGNPDKAKH